MRKGFIHIVEIVIITLVVFVLVVQLAMIPRGRSNWQRTKLRLQGNDLLFSLEKTGIDWYNKEEVSRALDQAFGGKNIRYDLELVNTLPHNITVGCVCDIWEYQELQDILDPFSLNGQKVDFNFKRIEVDTPAFPVDMDVIVVMESYFSASDLTPKREEINNYLHLGRGLVEIRELNSSDQISGKPVQEDIFGLKWNGEQTVNENDLEFRVEPNSSYYNMKKYFYSLPNSTGQVFPEEWKLPNFLSPAEKVGSGEGEAVLRQRFTGAPAVVVTKKGNRKGRTAWVSAGKEDLEEKKLVLKSVVLWASGERYRVIQNEIQRPVELRYRKVETGEGFEYGMYRPVEIILRLGYVFD